MRGAKLSFDIGGILGSLESVRFIRWRSLTLVLLLVTTCNVNAKKHAVPTGAFPEEATALLAFKDQLYRKVSLDSWDLALEPNYCAWVGVKCATEGYVKMLSLKQMGLVGYISPELAKLSRLKSINMHRNYLFGPIPSELAGMKSLRQVKLSYNRLTDTIPAAFGRSSLSTLILFNNNLTGPIPTSLANAVRLKQIRLGFNDMTGPIPEYFGDFTNLSVISLPGNGFSGSIPSQLGKLSTLLGLALDRNTLSGSIPQELFNCVSLRNLTLNQTGLSGPLSPSISALSNLALLDVGGNTFTGAIPPELGTLKRLKMLDLHGNNFTGSLPDSIGQLTNITLLDLSFLPGVNGSVPASLSALTRLQRVDLTNSSFSGRLPSGLIAVLPPSGTFNLSNNYFSGPVSDSLLSRIQANSSLASAVYGNCLSSDPSSPAYLADCATVANNICFLQQQRPAYQCLPYNALSSSNSNSSLSATIAALVLALLALAVVAGAAYAGVKRWRQGKPKALPVPPKVVIKAKEYKDVETGEIKPPPPDTYLPGMPGDIPRFSFFQLNQATECFTHLANADDPRAIYDATFLLPAAPATAPSALPAASPPPAAASGGGKEGMMREEHLSVQLVSFPGVYLDAMKDEFVSRVQLIHKARHPCLFGFRGYAYEDGNFALVYEPTRETLFDRLHEGSGAPLSWRDRMVIALGVAEALDFLHSASSSPSRAAFFTPPKSSTTPPQSTTPPHPAATPPHSISPLHDPHTPTISGREGSASVSVGVGTPASAREAGGGDGGQQQGWQGGMVHGDVKSCNVVITAHSKGKLAEFQVPCDDADDPLRSISARGSFGYLDPQYADTKKLTAASDVYSFGILLFELMSGRRAMLDDSSTLIVWVQQFFMRRDDYAGLLDGALVTMGGVPPSQLVPVIELAQDCTQVREESRPSIQQVREVLMAAVGVDVAEVYESGSVVGYGDGESDTTASHLDEGLASRRAADHAALETAAAAVLAAVAAGGAARQTLEVYDERVHSSSQGQGQGQGQGRGQGLQLQQQQQQQGGGKQGGEIEIEMMSEGSEEGQ